MSATVCLGSSINYQQMVICAIPNQISSLHYNQSIMFIFPRWSLMETFNSFKTYRIWRKRLIIQLFFIWIDQLTINNMWPVSTWYQWHYHISDYYWPDHANDKDILTGLVNNMIDTHIATHCYHILGADLLLIEIQYQWSHHLHVS